MEWLAPAGPERRGQFIRLGLLGIVAVVLLWVLYGNQGQTAAPPAASNAAAGSGGATPQAGSAMPEPLALSAHEVLPETLTVGRNPFTYGEAPRPEAPPVLPPVVNVPPPALAPPAPTGPPPIAVRLLGVVELPDGRIVGTLRDQAGAVFQAMEGQIVDGRYRVVKLGTQSVVLSYVDGSGQRTIPIGG